MIFLKSQVGKVQAVEHKEPRTHASECSNMCSKSPPAHKGTEESSAHFPHPQSGEHCHDSFSSGHGKESTPHPFLVKLDHTIGNSGAVL